MAPALCSIFSLGLSWFIGNGRRLVSKLQFPYTIIQSALSLLRLAIESRQDR